MAAYKAGVGNLGEGMIDWIIEFDFAFALGKLGAAPHFDWV
jgi:hypothetical protein